MPYQWVTYLYIFVAMDILLWSLSPYVEHHSNGWIGAEPELFQCGVDVLFCHLFNKYIYLRERGESTVFFTFVLLLFIKFCTLSLILCIVCHYRIFCITFSQTYYKRIAISSICQFAKHMKTSHNMWTQNKDANH